MKDKKEVLVVRGEAAAEADPAFLKELGELASKHGLEVSTLSDFEQARIEKMRNYKDVIDGRTPWTKRVLTYDDEGHRQEIDVLTKSGLEKFAQDDERIGYVDPASASSTIKALHSQVRRKRQDGSFFSSEPYQFEKSEQLEYANISVDAIRQLVADRDLSYFANIGPQRKQLILTFLERYDEAIDHLEPLDES